MLKKALVTMFAFILVACSQPSALKTSQPEQPAQSSTHTIAPTNTIFRTSTHTPTNAPTLTNTPLPTTTSSPSPTFTPVPSSTPLPTATSTPIPTPALPASSSSLCVPQGTDRQWGTVTNIIDGDTIDVQLSDGKVYTVRYIGMDSPEKDRPFYQESTAANQNLIGGKEVILVKDVSETDQYNRLLRYILVGDVFVNYELVRQGDANAYEYPPDIACLESFRAAEAQAQQAGLGLWAASTPTETPAVVVAGPVDVKITNIYYNGSGNNEPDEYVEIRNNGSQAVQLSGWTLRDKAEHVFSFPDFNLEPGATCRIYTDEDHPEACGFSFRFKRSAIWNNSGDCAYLRDSSVIDVDQYCYSG